MLPVCLSNFRAQSPCGNGKPAHLRRLRSVLTCRDLALALQGGKRARGAIAVAGVQRAEVVLRDVLADLAPARQTVDVIEAPVDTAVDAAHPGFLRGRTERLERPRDA